jgi:hypothetical protein
MPPTSKEPTMSRLDPTVVIRAARGPDGAALERLAQLDSQKLPAGELLVGERDGELVAAYAPATRAAIADPFRPTADIVALLELHGRPRAARERRRVRPALLRARAA